MNQWLRRSTRRSLIIANRVANSNRYSKAVKNRLKTNLVKILVSGQYQEIYNPSSYYPTIQEYYNQINEKITDKDPLFSIILPTFNTPSQYLTECIDSILMQSYKKWELCIADDHSTNGDVIKIIKEYSNKDPRIKYVIRDKNGHISLASNSAIKIATGDFIALMDHDDMLWPNALYENANIIRKDNRVDLIYSDEDKIDTTGKVHSYPFLKPNFSPEFLESCNYITHFTCIKRSLVNRIGGFRQGYEGAQDWDLFIRITELTNNVVHIPKILYSWRVHELSTASDTDAKPYVYEAQKKLLDDHIERLHKKGKVEKGIIPQHRTIKYDITSLLSLTVVIIYSTMENSERLLKSIFAQNAGMQFNLIIYSDSELPKKAKLYITTLVTGKKITFLTSKYGKSPNFLKSIDKLRTDVIICIKDAVVVISNDWARILVADVINEDIAVVGPVILDESRQYIYSAGLGIGYGPRGITNMLQTTPFNDPHYTRGLYAKSRRNVSAVNDAIFAIKTKDLQAAKKYKNLTDICLSYINKGLRCVYTPYVQAVIYGSNEPAVPLHSIKFKDPFLNTNFNNANGLMEVKK